MAILSKNLCNEFCDFVFWNTAQNPKVLHKTSDTEITIDYCKYSKFKEIKELYRAFSLGGDSFCKIRCCKNQHRIVISGLTDSNLDTAIWILRAWGWWYR